MKTEGFPWPGEWTVERDEARHTTTVHWKGKEGGVYPWGTETDYENLTYDADDAHPETSSVRGEAETVFALKGRTLTWRGHLLVTTDQKNFYYKYTRELPEGRDADQVEIVAGDDCPRPSVNTSALTQKQVPVLTATRLRTARTATRKTAPGGVPCFEVGGEEAVE